MAKRQASRLQREIQQTVPFASLAEETFLNLERTSSLLYQAFASRMRRYELTPTQYNALRILRGSHPAGLSCGEIGKRMVTPMPDVTRLVDRLERRQLVERRRETNGDRRVVVVRLRPSGLQLLARLDRPVLEWLEQLLGHLDDRQLRRLIGLLEAARAGADKGI